MSLSPSWTLDSQMFTPSHSSPNPALCRPHGTGGLFDTGLAGDASKLSVLPARSPEISNVNTLDAIDSADLLAFAALSNNINDNSSSTISLPTEVEDAAPLQEGTYSTSTVNDFLSESINNIKSEFDQMTALEGDDNVFYPTNDAVTGFNEDSLLGTIGNTDFLETLTDLSSFSNDGIMTNAQDSFDPVEFMKKMAEMEEQQEQPMEMEPVVPMTQIKRSASEAFDEVVDQALVSNPDHNDYTRKTTPIRPSKRARTCTVTSESDAESVVSTSSAFGSVSSTTAMSKDQKYLERRRKNNIASRRSRETRKQKFLSMDSQADELEAKNAALRIKVAELEKLTKLMKDTLVQQLANAGKAAAAAAKS